VSGDITRMLANRYGSRAAMIASIIGERPELAERIVPGAPAICAEVIHAIRAEMAMSLSDFLVRRTSMVWRDPASAIAAAPEVARLMGAELGWSGERVAAEVDDFFTQHALRDTIANRDQRTIVNRPTEDADGRAAFKVR
jgi:glycerol-3-phosphate dehydrogenase